VASGFAAEPARLNQRLSAQGADQAAVPTKRGSTKPVRPRWVPTEPGADRAAGTVDMLRDADAESGESMQGVRLMTWSRNWSQDVTALIARVGIGLVWMPTAGQNSESERSRGRIRAYGRLFPTVSAWYASIVEFVVAIALIIGSGYRSPESCFFWTRSASFISPWASVVCCTSRGFPAGVRARYGLADRGFHGGRSRLTVCGSFSWQRQSPRPLKHGGSRR